jgi:hypothetical protein
LVISVNDFKKLKYQETPSKIMKILENSTILFENIWKYQESPLYETTQNKKRRKYQVPAFSLQ